MVLRHTGDSGLHLGAGQEHGCVGPPPQTDIGLESREGGSKLRYSGPSRVHTTS